ncbi:SusC/RagA family TonB-linked outer membrane protein [Pontibacter diazotrophicus]|uniref:SusC/RagA family TonB-linked outer membrane protein n=1 Tax=Pontibacter diazotrophicus TaxID=1400979 RepID=A0A3D8L3W6_9BACT|nr:SusC/RagA family TonB-linked outer membrane protein [Pontibacter diazotrophicus]RDV11993.1 SusC/RagA family TonB-linked outer membrane protein [Pontibacter diazotrophicus]
MNHNSQNKKAWIPSLLLMALFHAASIHPTQANAIVPPQAVQNLVTVTGTVRLQPGSGAAVTLPGVTVLEQGTTNGTATDVNGNFQIQVQPDAVLVFSMVGYTTQAVAIDGRTAIDVTLEESDNTLKEVVVTGYQTIDRKMFTGSAALLTGEDAKREGITDVSRMLEGRVAGVSVQNVSGTFGAAPKIRVRGATSITGDNKPLWVVDGIILEDVVNVSNEQLSTGDPATLIGSSVAGLNPDDIESFQILKDASATAMYGARAMNGVVVITTKKGRVGKPLVSYTGNFSTYLKPTYRSFDIMNSADQMSVYAELDRKGWLNHSDASRRQNGGVYTKMYDMINTYDPASGTFALQNTPEARAAFLERYARANTDWFDVLFNNSFMQEHSVSISSGTEKTQLYFSTSFLKDEGWSVADEVKRFTGNARANFNFSDKLSLGLITQGSIRDQQAPGTIGRISNPVSGEFSRDFDINPFSYALNTSRTLTAFDENGNPEYFRRNFAPFNILNELENNTLDISVLDLKLQADLNYKIFSNLNYNFSGALRYANTNREHRVREDANMAMAYRAADDATVQERNRFLYRDPDNPEAQPVVVLPYGGFYNTNDDNLVSYYLRNTLDWDKTFDIHTFRVFASQELRYADRQNKFFNGYGYQYNKGGVPYIDPNIIKQGVEGNFNYYGMSLRYDRFLAYMANAAYSYNGKYNLNGTVRYDGSNLLGESRTARWLPTWNVSGSWNIDTEPFMQQQDMVNRLTLRATYGLTASMGNATNSSLVLQSGSTRRPYLSEVESMIYIQNLENSELTWEKQYETNVGVDAGLFNERLQLTVDGYIRNAFDLIGLIRTSGIGGEGLKVANYADMRSHGVEVTLGGGVVESQDWNLKSQFTFGYNEGEITNLKNNPDIWSLVTPEGGPKEGYPYRGLFSIRFDGLDPDNGSPLFMNENGERIGNVYLQSDETQYLKYEGPVDPIVNGGWFNSLRYKDFTLSALVTYSGGHKIRLNPAFKNSYTDLDAMPYDFLNRWVLAGDENTTNIPSILDRVEAAELGGTYPYNNYNYSTARVVDGDFVRMKQVSLSYNLPASRVKSIGFSSLSLSLVANNLWLIYADDRLNGQDPEFFGAGGVAMPVPRQFTLSLKAGL